MKKRFGLLLIMLVLIISGAFCNGAQEGGSDKFVVGYTNLADSDVWLKSTKDYFLKLAEQDPDLKILATDAGGDVALQLDQIENFIVQGVDAIMVTPVDYEGIAPAVEKANKAGIPVIAFLIKSAKGDTTYIGLSSFEAAKMQGDYMAAKLPSGAKIVYLEGTPGLYHATERKNGFIAGIESRNDVEIIASLTGNYQRDEGMVITEDWIQSFPHFDAVVAANDQMALGAIQALKAANRLDGVLVSGIDATYDACVAINAGEMTQSIFQNGPAEAEKCFNIIQDMKNGIMPAEKEIVVDGESITAENVQKMLDMYKAQ